MAEAMPVAAAVKNRVGVGVIAGVAVAEGVTEGPMPRCPEAEADEDMCSPHWEPDSPGRQAQRHDTPALAALSRAADCVDPPARYAEAASTEASADWSEALKHTPAPLQRPGAQGSDCAAKAADSAAEPGTGVGRAALQLGPVQPESHMHAPLTEALPEPAVRHDPWPEHVAREDAAAAAPNPHGRQRGSTLDLGQSATAAASAAVGLRVASE